MSAIESNTSVFSSAINENDHGASINLAAALGLGFSFFFLIFRFVTRWPFRNFFKKDDFTATIATFLAIVQMIAVIRAVEQGLGERRKQLDDANMRSALKALYVSNFFFIASLAVAKLAVIFLVQRLTNISKHRKAARLCTLLVVFWTLISIILVAIPCNSQLPWQNFRVICTSSLSKWIAVTVLDVLTELSLLALPLYFVWYIHISRCTKAFILVMFWVRICVPMLSILRLTSLLNLRSSSDFVFYIVPSEVLAQAQMHSALIFATVPSIAPFIRTFNTGYLIPIARNAESGQNGSKDALGHSNNSVKYAKQDKMKKSISSRARRPSCNASTFEKVSFRTKDYNTSIYDNLPTGSLRPERVENKATVERNHDFKVGTYCGQKPNDGHSADGASIISHGSHEIVVRKTIDVNVR